MYLNFASLSFSWSDSGTIVADNMCSLLNIPSPLHFVNGTPDFSTLYEVKVLFL